MNAFTSSALKAHTIENEIVKEAKVLLGAAWADEAYDLHLTIKEELPEQKKHFIAAKTKSYFDALADGTVGKLVGAMAGDKMIGMTCVLFAGDITQAIKANRITYTDPDGVLADVYGTGKVAVIQSLCVLKKYTKGGNCPLLVNEAIRVAMEEGCTAIFAQCLGDNENGRRKFEEQGFVAVATWTNGHKRYLMAKNLKPTGPVFMTKYKPSPELVKGD